MERPYLPATRELVAVWDVSVSSYAAAATCKQTPCHECYSSNQHYSSGLFSRVSTAERTSGDHSEVASCITLIVCRLTYFPSSTTLIWWATYPATIKTVGQFVSFDDAYRWFHKQAGLFINYTHCQNVLQTVSSCI